MKGVNVGTLGFADDLNILGEDIERVIKNFEILIQNGETLGLKANENKTKLMETIESDTRPLKIKNYIFKKIENFKYLGVNSNLRRNWNIEISNRIQKAEKYIRFAKIF